MIDKKSQQHSNSESAHLTSIQKAQLCSKDPSHDKFWRVNSLPSEVFERVFEMLKRHSPKTVDRELFRLNRDILRTVMQNYPLQGFIVENSGEQVLINLGEKQGVVQGTTFAVLADREPKKYQKKILSGSAREIGHIEIIKVESDLSIARIVNHEIPLEAGHKIREMLIAPGDFTERPVLQ